MWQEVNIIFTYEYRKIENTLLKNLCKDTYSIFFQLFFSFVGHSQLMRHHTYHTNIRTFECEICKKLYKTKRDLKLHLLVHSVQRPHKCSTCEKTFLSTSKLKQHLNVHTGSRPYKCDYCPKDFTNFPNWLKHTRRRHKVDHKTGEKLVVMPNFLKKAKKSNNTKNNTDTGGENLKINRSRDKKELKRRTTSSTKTAQKDEDRYIVKVKCEDPVDIIDFHDDRLMENIEISNIAYSMQSTEHAIIGTSSSLQTKCSTDLSTITVNNRTLPLNTSDDLERAASLLMHQTLELEDDLEYITTKTETIDPSLYQNQYNFYESNGKSISNQCNDFNFITVTDFQTNYHYSELTDPYSYYPQTTQCDFAMMPLPPINTVKSKLKCMDESTTIFSTNKANVL